MYFRILNLMVFYKMVSYWYHMNDRQAKQDVKVQQKRVKLIETEVRQLEHQFEAFNPEDIESAKEQRQAITAEVRNLRFQRNDIEAAIRTSTSNKVATENELRRINQSLDGWRNTSKQRERHIFNERRRKEREFKMWVETNRATFRGDVFGPIVNEMNVHDEQGALYLNAIISANVFYGYVCTDGSDWDTLVRKAGTMGLQITVYTSSSSGSSHQSSQSPVRRPVDTQFLQQCGVDGYLDQTFDAPEIIKRTLNGMWLSLCEI